MHLLLIGQNRANRRRAAEALVCGAPASSLRLDIDAARLPFLDPGGLTLPSDRPCVVRIDDLECAFPDNQIAGTRLVLTQSTYLLQKLQDQLRPDDRIVATADEPALRLGAAEAFDGRGPWRSFELVSRDVSISGPPSSVTADRSQGNAGLLREPSNDVPDRLAAAFASASPETRVALCRRAVEEAPGSAVAQLALGSALGELQYVGEARTALERAIELAPQWEAAHFEIGKFWLGQDDLEGARDGFQRAADIMPGFVAAHSNLGATLGELDDPQGALAAFSLALACDPGNITVLNNIGVVNRELGCLDQSENALRQVVALAPHYIFGYYNLGHTLFLGGDYAGALAAYEEGQRRDPHKNRRQGCRLALVRFANGDVDRAEQELRHFTAQAPSDEREDLLLEAYEIAQALVEAHHELACHRPFVDRIAAQIPI